MLTIACVLKSGGEFLPAHVAALREGVNRHLGMPHRFVCLSDLAVDCERIPLVHGWPGWWSKLELFRPGLFDGPVLSLDLDTIVVGRIDDLVTPVFTMLADWLNPAGVNSSLMAWRGDALSHLYATFLRLGPAMIMRTYRVRGRWGDQDFIGRHAQTAPLRWQHRHPGRVVSFKCHCEKGVPPGASIVCFHGAPRPWALPARQRAWFEPERAAA